MLELCGVYRLKKNIHVLEKVKINATKLVSRLRNFPYNKKLEVLELTSLTTQRERGDII